MQAVGEPPLFLAASVFFAIKEAIVSARKDRGEEGIFLMDSPATCERIRLACSDQFTKMVGIVHVPIARIYLCESRMVTNIKAII